MSPTWNFFSDNERCCIILSGYPVALLREGASNHAFCVSSAQSSTATELLTYNQLANVLPVQLASLLVDECHSNSPLDSLQHG